VVLYFIGFVFYRARQYCTVQSAVLRSHVVCPSFSLRLSVTLVDCDHLGWNSSKIPVVSRLVSVGRSFVRSVGLPTIYSESKFIRKAVKIQI